MVHNVVVGISKVKNGYLCDVISKRCVIMVSSDMSAITAGQRGVKLVEAFGQQRLQQKSWKK